MPEHLAHVYFRHFVHSTHSSHTFSFHSLLHLTQKLSLSLLEGPSSWLDVTVAVGMDFLVIGIFLLVRGFLVTVFAGADGLTFVLFLLSCFVGVNIPIGFVDGTRAIFCSMSRCIFPGRNEATWLGVFPGDLSGVGCIT